jgi:hypothetical protein
MIYTVYSTGKISYSIYNCKDEDHLRRHINEIKILGKNIYLKVMQIYLFVKKKRKIIRCCVLKIVQFALNSVTLLQYCIKNLGKAITEFVELGKRLHN